MIENTSIIKETQYNDPYWITIEDPFVAESILEALGDEDKKNILSLVLEIPRTIPEILETLQLPTTTGYRKIHLLINDELLITQGYIFTSNHTKIYKYKSKYENFEIQIMKNRVTIKALLVKKSRVTNSVILV